jgi:hypothetical protein
MPQTGQVKLERRNLRKLAKFVAFNRWASLPGALRADSSARYNILRLLFGGISLSASDLNEDLNIRLTLSCAGRLGAHLDLQQFTQKWFAMERRLALFADRSGGIPWWDVIRYRVNEYIFDHLASKPADETAGRVLPGRLWNFLRRHALRAQLRIRAVRGSYDVLVLRAPRQMQAGKPLDAGLDQLLSICGGRKLIIDTYPLYYHLPRRGTSRRTVQVGAALQGLLDALSKEFGTSWNEAELRTMIDRLLADFVGDYAAYSRLLERVRPRFVLLTQNGIEKALFAAARDRGIPVIEAQHGLIGAAHSAYSYPADVDPLVRSALPSTFLTFSDHWLRQCHYPVERRVSVGNDRLFVRALPPPAPPGEVMFITGDIYHAAMFDWAKRLAQAVPARRIIYKLHPNQQAASAAIFREAAEHPNIEVVDGTTSARSLLARVSHVVLIQSTVALETLQSGRRLCVLPLRHYRVHEDLFGLEAVSITPDMDSLIEAVDKPLPSGPPPRFFDPFDRATAAEVLREHLERPRPIGG